MQQDGASTSRPPGQASIPASHPTTPAAQATSEALLRRALRNAGYLLGGKSLAGVLGFATTALAARTLGLQDFGILLLVHSLAGAASAATRLQSWQPLLQYGSAMFHARERDAFQLLLRHCLALDALGAVAAMAIGLPLAAFGGRWLGWAGHGPAAMIYVTCAIFMNTGAAIGLMRLAGRYKMAAIADTAGAAVRLAGAVAGIILHWRLPGFLTVWYLSVLAAFSVDALVLLRLTRVTPSLHGFRLRNVPWRSRHQDLWKLVLSTSGNQALIGLSSQLGFLIVGAALGPADAALYRVTAQLGEALSQPANLLTPALYPEFVQLRDQGEWQKLRGIVHRVLQALAGFSLLALPVAAGGGPWLLAMLLGIHPPHILPLLLLMTAAAVIDLWDVPLEPLLISLGKARQLLHGRLWLTLLSLPLLYGLARLWGVDGAAVATLLRETGIFATRLVPFLAL
jgi:O-antigen/teichoic acid export membrane protein